MVGRPDAPTPGLLRYHPIQRVLTDNIDVDAAATVEEHQVDPAGEQRRRIAQVLLLAAGGTRTEACDRLRVGESFRRHVSICRSLLEEGHSIEVAHENHR